MTRDSILTRIPTATVVTELAAQPARAAAGGPGPPGPGGHGGPSPFMAPRLWGRGDAGDSEIMSDNCKSRLPRRRYCGLSRRDFSDRGRRARLSEQ